MRITFESDGGFAVFPALQRPMTIDTADLPPATATELENLVRVAREQPQPASVSPTAGADQITHLVTVEDDDGGEHSLRLTEPVMDEAVQALIERLSELRRNRA
ncbi:protealysin inhibitor emfourin [Amycolatopsis sp. NPDC059657]|uniref:protealysin inhibitor emfourin n=1 Tax=Amycolatopsis sp. NPDC059657 TaxID=3346899 RepID=UPI00366B6B1B